MSHTVPHRPPSHPAMNLGCYLNSGRGVYEVEEEILALGRDLYGLDWRKVFHRSFWCLRWLEFQFWPTTLQSVRRDRARYYAQLVSPDERSLWQ